MWFLVFFCDFRPIFPTFVAILRHSWPFCVFFRHTLWNSWLILPRGSNWWIILLIWIISWPYLCNFQQLFFCFSTVFLHFGHFLGVSRQLFAYFSQFKDQLNWTNNHIRISLIFPKYIKCHFRHFYLFIYLYTYVSPHFACSSWGDHDNDQGDQNWSWYRPRMISFSDTYCIRFGWTSGWHWTGGSNMSIF